MSGIDKRQLLAAIAPALQVASSEVTNQTEVIIDKPIRLIGVVAVGISANTTFNLFDGAGGADSPKMFLGELPIGQRHIMYCPGNVRFESDVRANLEAAGRHVAYTILYQDL